MWTYNYSYPDELYHYGVKGMKWKNHVYAQKQAAMTRRFSEHNQKRAAINRYRAEYNRNQAGKSLLSRAYDKITGADKIYGEIRYGMSKSEAKAKQKVSKPQKANSPTKKPVTKNTVSKGKTKTKKAVQNMGNKTVKSVGIAAQMGMRYAQNTVRFSPEYEDFRKMHYAAAFTTGVSPEYRRRYIYQ